MNTKNAIVVIAIGKSKMWDIGKKTIEKYCEKYEIPLEIITEKKYDTTTARDKYHYMNFEKNQVFELYDKYDRILRLDWDVIMTPHCPNVFEIVPEDHIGVVFEDVGPKRGDRLNRIKMIQEQLGDINWTSNYLNSGIILASKQHREIYHTTEEDVKTILNLKTRVSKEQNYLNYKVMKFNFKIFELEYRFNHLRFFSEPWNGSPVRHQSYIIHYAGSKEEGLKNMKEDNEILFLNKDKISKPKVVKEVLQDIRQTKRENKYITKKRQPFFKLAAKYLPLDKDSILVDIGAGDGLFAKYLHLKEKYDKLYLLDGNQVAVDKLKKTYKNTRLYRAPDELPFEDSSVDFIHCSHLIEHLYFQDLYQFFKEVDRVLCKYGIFVVSTPLLTDKFYRDLSHVKPYYPRIFVKYFCDKSVNRSASTISQVYSILDFVFRYQPYDIKELEWESSIKKVNFIVQGIKRLFSILRIRKYIKTGYTIVLMKEI